MLYLVGNQILRIFSAPLRFIKDPTIRGDGPGVPVVLKKVKAKVSGAEEMRASELYFNQRLQRTAPGSCAEFLGTITVEKSTQKRRLSSKLSEVSTHGQYTYKVRG